MVLNVLMEVKPNDAKKFTLFVGEGDFSYAASYLEKSNPAGEHVFATCLSSGALNTRQQDNIELIQSNGGTVLTDVDATQLEAHPMLYKFLFTKIVFNFPHVSKKMNIRENRKLVELFLKSAEKVLDVDGRIHVALCQGQGGTEAEHLVREWANSWQIVELASRAGLILSDIKPFDADNFEKYQCTGFRGLSKSFRMDAAVTHVFGRGCPVSSLNLTTIEKASSVNLVEWFLSDSENLYKSLSLRLDSPYARLVGEIYSTLKSTASQINSVFIENLISCETISSLNSNSSNFSIEKSEFEKPNICDKCLRHLLSIFLSNTKSKEIVDTTVICCINCFCMFDVSKSPLLHLLSYFSSNRKTLMEFLNPFFKSLKELGESNNIPEYSTWADLKTYSNQTVFAKELNQTCNEIVIEEVSPVQVVYSTTKSNCRIFYTDVNVIERNSLSDINSCFNIVHIVKFSCNSTSYLAALLNLELICALKYHVMDYRTLLLSDAYFSTEKFLKKSLLVFRSPSLFPPTYTHDISFWAGSGFKEKHLQLLVRRSVGLIVKSIKLIDLHYDEAMDRKGMCYRLTYQSAGEVLSKASISSINTRLRRTIETSLKVCLR